MLFSQSQDHWLLKQDRLLRITPCTIRGAQRAISRHLQASCLAVGNQLILSQVWVAFHLSQETIYQHRVAQLACWPHPDMHVLTNPELLTPHVPSLCSSHSLDSFPMSISFFSHTSEVRQHF